MIYNTHGNIFYLTITVKRKYIFYKQYSNIRYTIYDNNFWCVSISEGGRRKSLLLKIYFFSSYNPSRNEKEILCTFVVNYTVLSPENLTE
jgi:hypothetical protein